MSENAPQTDNTPWYRLMNKYHWIVFVVCSLGWAFDCMDQHLFTYVRASAVGELMDLDSASDEAINYGSLATSIMMIGWATGGIIFGIIGDKFGRARTMIFTILIYSILTGISAFSYTIWDFVLIRFLAGIGIGGQFAVGASLLAESMPERARPYVLGIMQVLSAFGNIGAALIAMTFTELADMKLLPMSSWRCIFLFGSVPAILAYFVVRYLREPDSWKESVKEGRKNVGSIKELFTTPMLRKHVVLGMILAAAGVIGTWGIGLFSMELARKVVDHIAQERPEYQEAEKPVLAKFNMTREDLKAIETEIKTEFGLSASDEVFKTDKAKFVEDRKNYAKFEKKLTDLHDKLNSTDETKQISQEKFETEIPALFGMISKTPVSQEKAKECYERLKPCIEVRSATGPVIKTVAERWAARNLLIYNIGAMAGMYGFTLGAVYWGRRMTFTVFMTGCIIFTSATFLFMNSPMTQLLLVPPMGFFLMSMFGGYTIYFPELFPTRLRSTGVSFCYNVGRYVAACGPLMLGALTSAFAGFETLEDSTLPFRYAGVAMCSVFLIGIAVIWFLPETKGKPLPE